MQKNRKILGLALCNIFSQKLHRLKKVQPKIVCIHLGHNELKYYESQMKDSSEMGSIL